MLVCEKCGKEFEKEESLKQHISDVHGITSHDKRMLKKREKILKRADEHGKTANKKRGRTIMYAAVVVLLLLGISYAVLNFSGGEPQATRPIPGDHWHADFQLSICGQLQPDMPAFEGNVHSHGDGLVHIHPATLDESGKNANLGTFFRSGGMELTNTSVTLFDGTTFANGDLCNNSTQGSLEVYINDVKRDDFLTYILQDGDKVRIEFS